MTMPGDHSGRLAGRPWTATACGSFAEENARLAGIVRSSHDAIFGATVDGVVTAWNPAAELLYGYRAEEIIGRPIEELCRPERRPGEAAVLRRIARGERLDPYLTERVRRDGSTVLVRLSVSPVIDDSGEIVGVAGASRAEAAAAVPAPPEGGRAVCQAPGPALDLDKAGQTRGILPARASHELRTPLQAIIGFTGTLLLRLPGPLNDEQARQLELVQESARQLLSMINQLARPVDR
jgi:PAS domain S-box-containing protein